MTIATTASSTDTAPRADYPWAAEAAAYGAAMAEFERQWRALDAAPAADKRAHRAACRALRAAAYAMMHAHRAYSEVWGRHNAGSGTPVPLGRLIELVALWRSRYYRRTGPRRALAAERLRHAAAYVDLAVAALERGAND